MVKSLVKWGQILGAREVATVETLRADMFVRRRSSEALLRWDAPSDKNLADAFIQEGPQQKRWNVPHFQQFLGQHKFKDKWLNFKVKETNIFQELEAYDDERDISDVAFFYRNCIHL